MLDSPEWMKPLAGLVGTGALIGVGKLLVSSEELTVRVVAGRAILGSATSTIAGIVLLQVPNISPLPLIAVGSALGIIGSQYVEKMLREKVKKLVEGDD